MINCPPPPLPRAKNSGKGPCATNWPTSKIMACITYSYTPDKIFNHLHTNGFFFLFWYNKLGIIHCTYLGVSGYNIQKILNYFVWRSFLPLQCRPWWNAALCCFHMGLHCLQNNLFRGFPRRVKGTPDNFWVILLTTVHRKKINFTRQCLHFRIKPLMNLYKIPLMNL